MVVCGLARFIREDWMFRNLKRGDLAFYVKAKTIAQKVGCSERTVHRHLDVLCAHGLKRVRTIRCNSYVIPIVERGQPEPYRPPAAEPQVAEEQAAKQISQPVAQQAPESAERTENRRLGSPADSLHGKAPVSLKESRRFPQSEPRTDPTTDVRERTRPRSRDSRHLATPAQVLLAVTIARERGALPSRDIPGAIRAWRRMDRPSIEQLVTDLKAGVHYRSGPVYRRRPAPGTIAAAPEAAGENAVADGHSTATAVADAQPQRLPIERDLTQHDRNALSEEIKHLKDVLAERRWVRLMPPEQVAACRKRLLGAQTHLARIDGTPPPAPEDPAPSKEELREQSRAAWEKGRKRLLDTSQRIARRQQASRDVDPQQPLPSRRPSSGDGW